MFRIAIGNSTLGTRVVKGEAARSDRVLSAADFSDVNRMS